MSRRGKAIWWGLWRWQFSGMKDQAMSAVVEGKELFLAKSTYDGFEFSVKLQFQVNSETSRAARFMAKHCPAR